MASFTLDRIEAPVTFKVRESLTARHAADNLQAYLMCAFAAVAGLLFGFDSGYISSVLGMQEFRRVYGRLVPLANDGSAIPDTSDLGYGYDYATWQKSLIVSILSAGTFFGALISGALADWLGRRTTIILGCAIFCVGVIIQVAAPYVNALVVGRLVAGFGVGFVSAINILYMSEVAPRKVRGAIVSAYQFAITIGIMLASCVCYGTQDRQDSGAYRIPIGMQFLWAIILAAGLLFLPESPRFFVKKQQFERAAAALSRVRGQPATSQYIQDELAEIQANFEWESQVAKVTWVGCFSGGFKRNSNLRKIFIGTMLQFFQQATGINFIFYYNTTFFQQVGIQNPFLISLISTVVNVCSTPFAFVTIERFGRRPLLIWGAVGMTVCELIIAIVGTADAGSQAAHYCLIVFVCLYIFFFGKLIGCCARRELTIIASTWGPAGWVLIGEIFQLPIRSKGVAISTASNWFWNCEFEEDKPCMLDG